MDEEVVRSLKKLRSLIKIELRRRDRARAKLQRRGELDLACDVLVIEGAAECGGGLLWSLWW